MRYVHKLLICAVAPLLLSPHRSVAADNEAQAAEALHAAYRKLDLQWHLKNGREKWETNSKVLKELKAKGCSNNLATAFSAYLTAYDAVAAKVEDGSSSEFMDKIARAEAVKELLALKVAESKLVKAAAADGLKWKFQSFVDFQKRLMDQESGNE